MDNPSGTEWLTPRQFLQRHSSVHRSWLYEHLRDGSLPHIRLGRKILLPADAWDRLLTSALEGVGLQDGGR